MRNFWHFSQQLYPDLPPIDAYLALHRDYVAPIVGPVLHGTLTTTEALALWTGSTPWVAKIQALRQGKEVAERLFSYTKSLCATQQSTLSSLTADEKQISAHLTTEILRRYTADTLGQPTHLLMALTRRLGVPALPVEARKIFLRASRTIRHWQLLPALALRSHSSIASTTSNAIIQRCE